MSWIEKLKTRWDLKNTSQVFIVLLVFACTGFTVMFLKRPVVAFFTADGSNVWFSVIYYILILPIYNVFLLMYGFLFGQFHFFWNFEKRMFRRMTGRHAEQK
jgi:hypothetical protein